MHDADAVGRVVAGADAVISTLGEPYTWRPVVVYSRGIEAVLGVMTTHGVGRLVCVTSTPVADGDAPGEPLAWRKGVVPLLRHVVGRTTTAAG